LLLRLEPPRRSTLAHHVHRHTRMGTCVMISGIWYKHNWRVRADHAQTGDEKHLSGVLRAALPQPAAWTSSRIARHLCLA
jgi:hypothetical protein